MLIFCHSVIYWPTLELNDGTVAAEYYEDHHAISNSLQLIYTLLVLQVLGNS